MAEYQIQVAKGKINADTTTAEDYIKAQLKKAGIESSGIVVTENGEIAVNTLYTDKNGDIAIIPEGFSVSNVASEQTIDSGLVIVDKEGNEFVWVPVDNIDLFKRTTLYNGKIHDPGEYYSEPYDTLSPSNDPTGEVAEYNAMYASVKKNHGFYIARYEAGKEGTDTVVSKKNATVWNNIPWGAGMTEVGTEGAVYRARQMYKGSNSVASTLCYSVQWDSALQFIYKTDSEYPNYAVGKGHFNATSTILTGSVEEYKVNNIYDMGGNVFEWTMETSTYAGSPCRAMRGGFYNLDVEYSGPNSREWNNADAGFAGCGFRVTLYLK